MVKFENSLKSTLNKTLYLVDVSSILFRAFYAVRPLSTSQGMPTNALYGFLSMIIKLLKDIKPDYIAFCFDHEKPSFRYQIDPNYKANREETPSELLVQFPYVERITDSLGIPKFRYEGFEADDLIGTLAQKGKDKGLEVIIVSSDKDFCQLISPSVKLYDSMKDVIYDEEGVASKWGVKPHQFIDYLSLVGDSSDNIQGVYGIGPKGAQNLLHEFKNLDQIYSQMDRIKSKGLIEKLKEGRDQAYLAKKLVTIDCHVPIKVELSELKLVPIHRETLYHLLKELEFKSFETKLLGSQGAQAPQVFSEQSDPQFELVKSKPNEIVEKHIELSDLEELISPRSDLWGLKSERGLFIGCRSILYIVHGEPLEVGKILSQKNIQWKSYDLKEFWHFLELTSPKGVWDQQLAAYVIRPGSIGSFEELVLKYLKIQIPSLPTPSEYYDFHLQLEVVLLQELKKINGTRVFEEIELPLVPILYNMERLGVRIDGAVLKEQSSYLSREIREIEKEIYNDVGQIFNIASPKQLAQMLFGKLKMPTGKRTKTGFSTDNDVLEKLSKEYPLCLKILDYRELAKLKSTYVDNLLLLIDKRDGRIHTHYNQALTSTGRLSSTHPNLQNIPIRTERGVQIRKAFIADSGCKLVSADYSQIELRLLAHITEDPGLCRAFQEDVDIHSVTAKEIFGFETITPEQRRKAKAVNFGITYGQGPFGLAETLKISQTEAKEIMNRYFTKFPKLHEYMNEIVKRARENGYVETIWGRRRYIDELKSKNSRIRSFGERAAINAPMQGSASDLVKRAMIEIQNNLNLSLLLQVHDELVFEIENEKIDSLIPEIKSIMENVITLKVPLKVNIAFGTNWEEAHS